MLSRRPGWMVDDATSVREEAEPYRALTPDERGAYIAAACRGAARILASRSDAARVLEYRDPLPESTLRALRRLRRTERAGAPR